MSYHQKSLNLSSINKTAKLKCFEKMMAKKLKSRENERRRNYEINLAFGKLQRNIPYIPDNAALPKVKTLRLAVNYIKHLNDLLQIGDRSTPLANYEPISQQTLNTVVDKCQCEKSSVNSCICRALVNVTDCKDFPCFQSDNRSSALANYACNQQAITTVADERQCSNKRSVNSVNCRAAVNTPGRDFLCCQSNSSDFCRIVTSEILSRNSYHERAQVQKIGNYYNGKPFQPVPQYITPNTGVYNVYGYPTVESCQQNGGKPTWLFDPEGSFMQ